MSDDLLSDAMAVLPGWAVVVLGLMFGPTVAGGLFLLYTMSKIERAK